MRILQQSVLSMAAASFLLVGGTACGGATPLSASHRAANPAQDASSFQRSPSEQYLNLRHLYPPMQGLTPKMLAEDPKTYRGMTLELEGRLTGIVQTDDGGALLMLSTERSGSLNLTMSLVPTWLQSGTRLRVLVVATGAPEDTVVVGVPDMKVVAVASANDIAAAEYKWRQTVAARQAKEKQYQAAMAANRSRLASRSNAVRGGSSVRTAVDPNAPLSLSPAAKSVYPYYRDFIQSWNKKLPATQAASIAASVLLFSERYDVDPRLVIALLIAESDFRPGITSNKGAMGLGQIMPDEAKDLGLSNPYDPVQNVAGAVYLLRGRLDKYSGGKGKQDLTMQHIILALASYNAGMGAVKKYGGVPPYRETQNYVKKIERIYRQLCAGDTAGGPA